MLRRVEGIVNETAPYARITGALNYCTLSSAPMILASKDIDLRAVEENSNFQGLWRVGKKIWGEIH